MWMLSALDATGHVVSVAADGAEGLTALDAVERPCLVFLDLLMPELDGVGFLSALSERGDRDQFTVVVMSALPGAEQAVRRFSSVVRVLSKPLGLKTILPLVEQYCSPAS